MVGPTKAREAFFLRVACPVTHMISFMGVILVGSALLWAHEIISFWVILTNLMLIVSSFWFSMSVLGIGYLPFCIVIYFSVRVSRFNIRSFVGMGPILGLLNGVLLVDAVNFGVGPNKEPLWRLLDYEYGVMTAVATTITFFLLFGLADRKYQGDSGITGDQG